MPFNERITFISLSTAPSEPPKNLSVQHTGTSELTFQLEPVDKYHINGRLRGYKGKYRESPSLNEPWKTFVINVTQTKRRKRSIEDEPVTFNLEGLKAHTTYTVIVLAFTVKDGVPTLAANFTTAEDGTTQNFTDFLRFGIKQCLVVSTLLLELINNSSISNKRIIHDHDGV